NMVAQQTNMALMLLGKVPHPETGQTVTDVDAAQMFIDQLEMLEAKTKGNLNKQEESLLKQSLMALRLTFVEAIEKTETPAPEKKSPAAQPAAESKPTSVDQASQTPGKDSPSAGDTDSRKKFSKKY